MAKRELEAVILAAQKLSNFAFNVAQQNGRIPDSWRESARDVVSEFDHALRAFRCATKPKKRTRAIETAAKKKGAKR